MIDYIFYLCVDILIWLAKVTGTTYEFINILIFIIGYPLFVILLLAIILRLMYKIKVLKKLNESRI